eukprot:m.239608 g.239608  ORF g.239608 m.239608 type:complete len:118 (-) comp17434_c0_seq11:1437-1790(-)
MEFHCSNTANSSDEPNSIVKSKTITNNPAIVVCINCQQITASQLKLPHHGINLLNTFHICTSCHNPRCINRIHVISVPMQQLQQPWYIMNAVSLWRARLVQVFAVEEASLATRNACE